MSDRAKTVVVTFQDDTALDYAEHIAKTLRCLYRVTNVTVNPTSVDDLFAIHNAKFELKQQLLEVLK